MVKRLGEPGWRDDPEYAVLKTMGAYDEGFRQGEGIGQLMMSRLRGPPYPSNAREFIKLVAESDRVNRTSGLIGGPYFTTLGISSPEVLTAYETGVEDGARSVWKDPIIDVNVFDPRSPDYIDEIRIYDPETLVKLIKDGCIVQRSKS
jgi:hypothetical protein